MFSKKHDKLERDFNHVENKQKRLKIENKDLIFSITSLQQDLEETNLKNQNLETKLMILSDLIPKKEDISLSEDFYAKTFNGKSLTSD